MFYHGFLEAHKILFVSDLAGKLILEADSRYYERPRSFWLPFESEVDKV